MKNDNEWSIIGCGGKVFAGKIQNAPDEMPASAAVLRVWSCFEIVDVRQVGRDGLLQQVTQYLNFAGLSVPACVSLKPSYVVDLADMDELERKKLASQFDEFTRRSRSAFAEANSPIVKLGSH